MDMWETVNEVERDPNKVSGAWIFRGTRVPVSALFENLRDGATIEEFIEWFPGVTKTHVSAVLNFEIAQLTVAVYMKILFDQGTPVPLRRFLVNHEVRTAYNEGWSKLENGDLLLAAENSEFQILVTTDQNLRYQQNLAKRKIAIVVLLSTSWPKIRDRTDVIESAIDEIDAGGYVEISI